MSNDVSADVTGRVAIITGAGRGLGCAMALGLASAGAKVVLVAAREKAEIDAVAAQLGPDRALAFVADVSDETACQRLIESAMEKFGRIDVLVNNAGRGMKYVSESFMTEPTRFWNVPLATWKLVIDTNVTGPFLMARAVAPLMIAAGWGRIVNISVSRGTMRRAGFSPYGPSKAALESETLIWSQDLDGFESSKSNYIIQPVLGWANDNVSGWTMHTEAVSHDQNNPFNIVTNILSVKQGDTIIAGIAIDTANPGPNCNLSLGTNCNYTTGYIDSNNTNIAANSGDILLKQPPDFAVGLVLEVPLDGESSCNDFPEMIISPVVATTIVREFSSTSDVFHDFGTNWVAGQPNTTNPVQFQSPFLSSGAQASCGWGVGTSGSQIVFFGI